MFDPNKYDSTNTAGQDKGSGFMEKREAIIKYLLKIQPLIIKECEFLDKKVEENPNTDMAEAFKAKLDGWSRILNGTKILSKKYSVNE